MLHHLPFADPGTPDLSTPGRFLRWMGFRQKRLARPRRLLGRALDGAVRP